MFRSFLGGRAEVYDLLVWSVQVVCTSGFRRFLVAFVAMYHQAFIEMAKDILNSLHLGVSAESGLVAVRRLFEFYVSRILFVGVVIIETISGGAFGRSLIHQLKISFDGRSGVIWSHVDFQAVALSICSFDLGALLFLFLLEARIHEGLYICELWQAASHHADFIDNIPQFAVLSLVHLDHLALHFDSLRRLRIHSFPNAVFGVVPRHTLSARWRE